MRALIILLCSFLELPLLLILPVDPGAELALAYVPIFFILTGAISALIYWLLTIILKRKLSILFYVLSFGLLTLQVIAALEMCR